VQVNEEDYHSAVGELFSYAGYQRHHKASQPRTQKEQTQAQPGPYSKKRTDPSHLIRDAGPESASSLFG